MNWQLEGKAVCLCGNLLMLVNHICKAPVKQKLSWFFSHLNLAHDWQLSLVLSRVKEGLSRSSIKADLAFLTAHKTKDWDCKRCAAQGRLQWRKSYVHKESWGRLGKKAVALLEAIAFTENEGRLEERSRNHQKLTTAGSQPSGLLSHPRQNSRSCVYSSVIRCGASPQRNL